MQVHECHVKLRSDIFEHTDSIINGQELANMIENSEIFVAEIEEQIVGYIILSIFIYSFFIYINFLIL